MKGSKLRDQKSRIFVYKNEEKKRCLQALKKVKDLNLSWWARNQLPRLGTHSLHNTCLITGRSKSVNKTYKLSRLEFTRWIKEEKLPGIRRSSW